MRSPIMKVFWFFFTKKNGTSGSYCLVLLLLAIVRIITYNHVD
jgi:hypothetical protein